MIIGEDWRAYIQENFWSNRMDVFLIQDFGNGRQRFLQKDGSTIERDQCMVYDRNAVLPFASFDRGQLQAIVEALAEKGFVPKGRRHEEELALVKDHLEDMRAIVFKKSVSKKGVS